MGKKHAKRDPIERARRRLVVAQAALQDARDDRARVQVKGERRVERARRRSTKKLSKATWRVERRSGAVVEAQRELVSLQQAQRALAAERPPVGREELKVVPRGDDTGRAADVAK